MGKGDVALIFFKPLQMLPMDAWQILVSTSKMLKGSCWANVTNGKSIPFWKEHWLFNDPILNQEKSL